MSDEEQQIAKTGTKLPVITDVGMNLSELGGVLAKSGVFKDTRDAYVAMVKVLAGRELGLSPIASMSSVFVFDGKIVLGAQVYATMVRMTQNIRYKVLEHTTEKCSLEFRDGTEVLGVSEFTIEDAKRAGLLGKDNWKNYPKMMLFHRAMKFGVQIYAPEIMGGVRTYLADEVGRETDQDGNTIEAEIVEKPTHRIPAPRSAPEPPKSAGEGMGKNEWDVLRLAADAAFPNNTTAYRDWLMAEHGIAPHAITMKLYPTIVNGLANVIDEHRVEEEVATIVSGDDTAEPPIPAESPVDDIADPFALA